MEQLAVVFVRDTLFTCFFFAHPTPQHKAHLSTRDSWIINTWTVSLWYVLILCISKSAKIIILGRATAFRRSRSRYVNVCCLWLCVTNRDDAPDEHVLYFLLFYFWTSIKYNLFLFLSTFRKTPDRWNELFEYLKRRHLPGRDNLVRPPDHVTNDVTGTRFLCRIRFRCTNNNYCT